MDLLIRTTNKSNMHVNTAARRSTAASIATFPINILLLLLLTAHHHHHHLLKFNTDEAEEMKWKLSKPRQRDEEEKTEEKKMKWKLMKPRQRSDEEEEMEQQQTTTTTTSKKKASASSNSSPSSSSSSTFSISRLLPLSWLASRLKPSKRSATTFQYSRSTAKPCYSRPSPPPSPRLQPPYPGHVPARFPPLLTASDVPHRRSLGDDGGVRPRGTEDARADPRRWRRHHYSVGDLDLTLGHLIPFSVVRPRAMGSDSGSDGSADTDARNGGLRRSHCRRRRPQRQISKAVRPSDTDSGDVVLSRRPLVGRIRRPRAKAKVRVSSPRTSSPAAAGMARRRRRRAEDAAKARRELERFAVVTRSRDPHRDFRESMVEMIWEKGIGRPEELEDLLACYLSLNAQEHHDVIVKAFRQVWFELDPELFSRCNY